MREGTWAQARPVTAALAALLVLVPVLLLPDGDPGLVGALGAAVALAVLAWAGRRDPGVSGLVATLATTPAREARRLARRAGTARQCDPGAAGRPRPRAPGLLHRSRERTPSPPARPLTR